MLTIYNEDSQPFKMKVSEPRQSKRDNKPVELSINRFKYTLYSSVETINNMQKELPNAISTVNIDMTTNKWRSYTHNMTGNYISIEKGGRFDHLLIANLVLGENEKIVDVQISNSAAIIERKFKKYEYLTFTMSYHGTKPCNVNIVRYDKVHGTINVTKFTYEPKLGMEIQVVENPEDFKWRNKTDSFRITPFTEFRPFHLVFVPEKKMKMFRESFGQRNHTLVPFSSLDGLKASAKEWFDKGFIVASLFIPHTNDKALTKTYELCRDTISQIFDKSSITYSDKYVTVTTDFRKLTRRFMEQQKKYAKGASNTKGKAPNKPKQVPVKPTPYKKTITEAMDEVVKYAMRPAEAVAFDKVAEPKYSHALPKHLLDDDLLDADLPPHLRVSNGRGKKTKKMKTLR